MLKITFFNQMPYIQDRTGWPYYHGDCTYIEFPNGQNMLIDISTKYSGDFLTQKLVEMQVKSIDYFVISHLHQDHTAGFVHLINQIPVKNIICSGYGFHNKDIDRSFFPIIKENALPLQQYRMGNELCIGDVKLQFLFPAWDAPEAPADMPVGEQGRLLNLYSLVFRLTYGNFSALFTGDIHYETEEEIVNLYHEKLESTLLKIPHHGNETSTGKLLVDTVKPKLAVVMSTGCEWIVQRKFSNIGVPLYGTYSDGTITAETDGAVLKMICEKGCREFLL